MGDVRAVLLVPTEGDPLGLIGDTKSRAWKAGARPPMAHRRDQYATSPNRFNAYTRSFYKGNGLWTLGAGNMRSNPRALVLAWDGEPVAEGLDRLARCEPGTDEEGDPAPFWVDEAVADVLWHGPTAAGSWAWPGTIILLDADGREVRRDA